MSSSSPIVQPGRSSLAKLARHRDLTVVPASSRSGRVSGVAFDQFVFESDALCGTDVVLERGLDVSGVLLAVASTMWRGADIEWVAIRSRAGTDHLGLVDEMEQVGHRNFDEAFAVDSDDASEFRRMFRTSFRGWLVDLDAEHGPLTIIFSADDTDVDRTVNPLVDPRVDPHVDPRVDLDPTDDETESDDTDRRPSTRVFLAREVHDDDSFVETMTLAAALVERLLPD